MRQFIAGSRESKLAMVQTRYVIDALKCDAKIKTISTRGDKIQDVALSKIGGKSFFTKELDTALLAGEIDFAVHSFKDVPTELPEGIMIAAVPKRESACDALVGPYSDFNSLPCNAVIGTSSLRRKATVLWTRADLQVKDIRGNLDTRIKKQSEGLYDSIIVAEAGLKRLGHSNYYSLDPKTFIPAAGQGALVVMTRTNDKELLKFLDAIDDPTTRFSSECERLFLAALDGGCQIPAGIYTTVSQEQNSFQLFAFVASTDGKKFLRAEEICSIAKARELSFETAKKLLDLGGKEILNDIRKELI